nr:uncharacterized protein LOC116776710 [Danaus plexippus plexippus]
MSEWYRMKNGFNSKLNSSEISVETSCDISDSFNIFSDNLSPIPAAIVPRKLDFSSVDDDECIRNTSPTTASLSPPYKRVRALKLFDSPHTPKTLLEKCSTPSHHTSRIRLFPPKVTAPNGMSGSSHHLHPPSDEDSALGSLPPDDDDCRRRRPLANINPFTPDGQALNKKKRALSKTPTLGESTPEKPAKRLRESNISRYNVEFMELGVIGSGQFGRVARALNRLDGCVYALKRSLRPVAGSAAERAALNEVYAHAALGKHEHLVRYYSAWAEDDHMIIQNEYCDGGSLQQKMEAGPLPESELLLILAHVADGLAYIHSQQLVHMDVKPGNIFICTDNAAAVDSDDGYDDDDLPPATHKYKIGDLGHVTCISSPSVEEGDCRYLPKEVLQEDFTHLTKADIFAFGLTLFEAGGGGPLPKNGPQWHAYRDGHLPGLPQLSREFNQLLKKMVDPDPSQRPSAARLRRHALLHPAGNKSKAQLRRELAAARLKNELLTRKLQEAARCIKSLTPGLCGETSRPRTRAARRSDETRQDRRTNMYGDLVTYDTPARVTVASDFANRTYPLFVTARQQKGVFSWQLPMLVQTPDSSEQFTNISRTLCPHNNIFSEDEDACDVPSLNIPIVHLTSSSPDPIKVTIFVETVKDFFIQQNSVTNLTSTPSQPKYYFYPFDQGPNRMVDIETQSIRKKYMCNKELDAAEQGKLERYLVRSDSDSPPPAPGWLSRAQSVIVMIESDDDVCAVVSIQNFSCPVFDNERDILYDGFYLTMTRRGGITLTQDSFPYGFYIVFIVKTSDEACYNNTATPKMAAEFGWGETVTATADNGRVKTFSFSVVPTISYSQYLLGAAAPLGFFLSFYVAFAAAVVCQRKRPAPDTERLVSPATPHDESVVSPSCRRRVVNDASCSSAGDGPGVCSSSSDTESDVSAVELNTEKQFRVDGRLCVAHLARCRPRVLSSRSRMYLWGVLTVAVFYTLPVIQLVVTYQRLLNQSGNQDLCYFNFLCAHPLGSLSDFNHVYSNVGYILLGALFLLQVRRRHLRAETREQTDVGIPQHWGLLYALGVSLLSEGLLSAAYHVCPNSMNFQFDTSFMYVTSVLCMVKIYQSRHADINARAHATFGVLALIIFIGLVGVLNANVYFWVLFTVLHLVTCLVLTFQIYYLGRFKFDLSLAGRGCLALLRVTHA